MPEQIECCRHGSASLCTCPQGFKSHAMPDDESDAECECGKIVQTTQRWKNCSGQTHVFQIGATKCGCCKRVAGMAQA